jgi:hypothetical protein
VVVIERPHAKVIACTEELLIAWVENGKGEVTEQSIEASLTPF